jgi:exopolyphosphatase/guanosine-5'-triphosphate,3'-diphosphate pyrophosphatase
MADLEPPWDLRAIYLTLILRIAVLLHRNRSAEPLPAVTLTGRPKTLELRFMVRTFRDHPLTAADLNVEIGYLREAGLRLRVFTS